MSPEIVAAIIGATVGLAGIMAASIQAYLSYRERQQNALNENISRALERFVGGRQERNVGISMIGHYWHQAPHLEGVFVRLLTNQGIYIIAEGDPEKAHEFNNMERIVRLLASIPASQIEYDQYYRDLTEQLRARRSEPDGNRVTHAVIDDWIHRLAR
jgi:hypothetical protein